MSVLAVNAPPPPPAQELAAAPVHSAPRPWGFWATTAGFLAASALAMACVIGVIFAVVPAAFADEPALPVELIAYLAFGIALVLILALLARLSRLPVVDYLALKRPAARDLALGSLSLLLLSGASFALLHLFGIGAADDKFMRDTYRAAQAAGVLPLFWFTSVAAAPALEELAFRGFLYRGWAASALGPLGAIVSVAVLFGVAHQQYTWFGIAECTVFGLIAGWLRWRSGTVLAPIFVHALNNLIATVYVAYVAVA